MFEPTATKKLTSYSLLIFSFLSFALLAEDKSHLNHTKSSNHTNTSKHTNTSSHHQMQMAHSPLTEAGNDVFGTIQEVITKLNADPSTDWSKVNIEALRKHLVDMYEMTVNVNIISQEPIENGLSVKMEAIGSRSFEALKRVFSAHPMMLKKETGWIMDVVSANGFYHLTITTTKSSEIEKIRGLGYIGLMAYGNHHQPHHWAMAKGDNPHHGHH